MKPLAFRPLTIDERIQKICMAAPGSRFWRLLLSGLGSHKKPLHPAYVCWFNSCEDLADWTFSGATGSINTTTYMENVGSLQIDAPADGGGYGYASVDPCDEYWGHWLRINTAISRFEQWLLRGTPLNYYVGAYPHAATRRWNFVLAEPGGSHGYESDLLAEQNVWYWFEVRRYYDVGTWQTTFRINGGHGWTYAGGGDIGAFQRFEAGRMGVSGMPALTMLVDYLRFSDRWEYPPG